MAQRRKKRTCESFTLPPVSLSELLIEIATISEGLFDSIYAYSLDIPQHHFTGKPLEQKVADIVEAVHNGPDEVSDRLGSVHSLIQARKGVA